MPQCIKNRVADRVPGKRSNRLHAPMYPSRGIKEHVLSMQNQDRAWIWMK